MKFNNIEWLFFDVGSTLVSEEKPFFIDFMKLLKLLMSLLKLYKRPEYNCD